MPRVGSRERPCQWVMNPPKGPTICGVPAILRVRVFEADDSTQEIDLCGPHCDEAAGFYPDNIQTVEGIHRLPSVALGEGVDYDGGMIEGETDGLS